MIVDGGEALQPVLYSLALEQATGRPVVEGRLYYATTAGGYQRRPHSADAAGAPRRRRSARDHRPRDRDRLPRAGAGRRGRARGAISGRCAAPTAERRVAAQDRRSRSPISPSCGGSRDAVRMPLDARRPSQLIRDALDDTVIVEAAAGTGKTTELVERILNVLAQRPRAHRADRRGHLHREGGRRAEAAASARSSRARAAGGDARRARRNLDRRRFSISKRRTSARSTASAPTCCASGRSRRASIRCSRCSPSRRPSGLSTKRSAAGCMSSSRSRRKASAARCVAACGRATAATTTTGPIERIRRAGARARRVARFRRRRGGATRSIATRRSRACSRASHELAALIAAPPSTRRSALSTTRALVRELSQRRSATARGSTRADPDGWEARVDRSRAEPRLPARAHGPRPPIRRGRCRATRSGPRTQSLLQRARRLPARGRLPTSPRCCTTSCATCVDALRGAEARRGRARLSSICCCARAICSSTHRGGPRARSRRASRTCSSTSSRTPIRCRPRSCCCWPPTIPPSATGSSVTPGARQAVHRRRSEAVDLPVPARRRRDLPRGVRAARRRAARRRAYLHTSFRVDADIQRVVNAAFAPLMTGDRATLQARVRARCRRTGPTIADQPSVVALPVPEPYGQRRVAGYAIEKSLPDAVGAFVALAGDTRAAGRSPSGRRATSCRCRCRSSRATSASCSAASCTSARTSRAPTSRRSRRAASRTCSSAASRFTTAKRSRRCARRSRRSSGPTTSCRCSRRCAARCSRSTMRRCSSTGTRTGAFIRSACRTTVRRASAAGRRRAAAAAAAARAAQLPPGRRHDHRSCSTPRARTSASCCGRPASRRSPTCCTSPSWRGSTS